MSESAHLNFPRLNQAPTLFHCSAFNPSHSLFTVASCSCVGCEQIENNLPAYYADFMNELRTLSAGDTSRQYFISAAPQCVYPDASLGPDHTKHNVTVPTAITHAAFDWLNMQFYNNGQRSHLTCE